ncbi:MAG: outer membrane protein OmpA-like peptidoglycan-associated protein [Kiritimatiellia bacterium]|jgi:outer membrane protein OmpA-like peptidoglycan-associated protein
MNFALYQFISRLLPLVILLVGFPSVSAAQSEVVVGFSDHSLLAGFADSVIIERELQRDINYRIVLGALERVRGEVIPEDSERLRGDVIKITYEISQEFTGEDVYAFYQEQLTAKNYEVLYSCGGRECGSSNYWANDIFRNRILYGPERNQHFIAFRANSALENSPYFSVYIITRVNRKIYAHIEIVEPAGTEESEQVAVTVESEEQQIPEQLGGAAASNLLQRLQEQGSVILPPISFQSNDGLAGPADVESLVWALNSDQALSVYVVAHLKQDGQSLQELMQRSLVRANSLRQALIAAGIDAQRIEAAGVGPLAPSCASGDCEERVEIVLR